MFGDAYFSRMFARMLILKTNTWVWPIMEKRKKTELLKPLNRKYIKSVFGEVPLSEMLDKLFGLTLQLKILE